MVRHGVGPLALPKKRRQSDSGRVAVEIAEEAQSFAADFLEGLVHGDADETTAESGKFVAAAETQAHGRQNESETAVHRRRAARDQLDVHHPEPTNSLQSDEKRQNIREIPEQSRHADDQRPGKPLKRRPTPFSLRLFNTRRLSPLCVPFSAPLPPLIASGFNSESEHVCMYHCAYLEFVVIKSNILSNGHRFLSSARLLLFLRERFRARSSRSSRNECGVFVRFGRGK